MSLREMRGASEGLRGHSVRRTSSSHDHRVLRDQLLGLVPILALSLPASPTTCMVRTGAVTAVCIRAPDAGYTYVHAHMVYMYPWGGGYAV